MRVGTFALWSLGAACLGWAQLTVDRPNIQGTAVNGASYAPPGMPELRRR